MTAQVHTVLITGATSGIGLEFARIYHGQGCPLILVGRDLDRLDRVRVELTGRPAEVILLRTDLSRPGAAESLYEECGRRDLGVDVLINNAGVGMYGSHPDLPLDRVAGMIALNVTAPTVLCALFGRDMRQRRSGWILNVASTAGYQPFPDWAAYGATKSYMLNFSEALAMELEDYGVVVSCLSPGPTESAFFDRSGLGNGTNGLMAPQNRMSAREVALRGVRALAKGELSVIPGLKNNVLAHSGRLAPRKVVARVSKAVSKRL
ncbi:MAG: SDR family oxidoreductase [Proteobacteria bacterium]|nr:SDR family oxidoreductase [Pseudomonadota bacterium]